MRDLGDGFAAAEALFLGETHQPEMRVAAGRLADALLEGVAEGMPRSKRKRRRSRPKAGSGLRSLRTSLTATPPACAASSAKWTRCLTTSARREAPRSEFEEIEQRSFQESDEGRPEEIDPRLAEIEAQPDCFEKRPIHYDPDNVTRAGVFVSIVGDGRLKIERGYVPLEDEAPVEPGSNGPDTDAFISDHVEGRGPAAPSRAPRRAVPRRRRAGSGRLPRRRRHGLNTSVQSV